MKETWSFTTIIPTGERVYVYKRLSWGKIYYSFDMINWSDKKVEAYKISTKQTFVK